MHIIKLVILNKYVFNYISSYYRISGFFNREIIFILSL